MIITEHPPVTAGGRTTYTVHIEGPGDRAELASLEAQGFSIGVFSGAQARSRFSEFRSRSSLATLFGVAGQGAHGHGGIRSPMLLGRASGRWGSGALENMDAVTSPSRFFGASLAIDDAMPVEDSGPHVADVIEGLRAYAEGGVDVPWEIPANAPLDVDATIAFIDSRAYVKNWMVAVMNGAPVYWLCPTGAHNPSRNGPPETHGHGAMAYCAGIHYLFDEVDTTPIGGMDLPGRVVNVPGIGERSYRCAIRPEGWAPVYRAGVFATQRVRPSPLS